MPSQWMVVNPQVADVAEWGTKDLPLYTRDLNEDERAAAEERIAAEQARRIEAPPAP